MADNTALATIGKHFDLLVPQFTDVLQSSKQAIAMKTAIIWSIQNNKDLMECTPDSLMRFGMTAVSLQLQPDPKMGQIFALPFSIGGQGGKRQGQNEAQTVMGYKGYNTLGWRDRIAINGNVVRGDGNDRDHFEFSEGTNGHVEHVRQLGHWSSRPIIAAWATATAFGHAPIVVVMDIDEIEDVKAKAPAAKSQRSPWNDPRIGFPAMAMKTAKRRLARSLPIGAFLMAAVMEEQAEEVGKRAWIEPTRDGPRLMVEGEHVPVDMPKPQPAQTPEEIERLGQPKKFPIRRKKGVFPCASIDEWKWRMESAIQALTTVVNLEGFIDMNADTIQELHHEFRDHVDAVMAAVEKRKGEL